MLKVIAITLVALAAIPAAAAPPVRVMFNDAMARERAVRAALADPAAPETILKAVRTAVAAYEAVVRQYPTSSYSDNALWQAGRLSMAAFERFGGSAEKEQATRLLSMLGAQYPTSKLARQVPFQLAALAARPPKEPPPNAVTPPAQAGRSGPPAEARSARPDLETPNERSPQPVAPTRTVEARKSRATIDREGADSPASPAAESPVRTTSVSSGSPVAIIKGIRRVVLPDVVRVVIEMDREAPFHEERIAGPSRIFVDFHSTRTTPTLVDQTLQFDADRDIVKQVRLGRHPNRTTRVVIDAAGVSSYSVYPLYGPYRLVIDCLRATTRSLASATPPARDASSPARPAAPPADLDPTLAGRSFTRPIGLPSARSSSGAIIADARAEKLGGRRLANYYSYTLPTARPRASAALKDARTTAPLASRAVAPKWSRRLPSMMPVSTAVLADVYAPAPGDPTSVLPSAARTPVAAVLPHMSPPANRSAGVSMARQLGLGVSRIVIDPGHGGHDPGAKGKGINEAELVLDVSLRLEQLLAETHSFEVILTRRTDEFVPLQERTARANREGADLFLSIHANASANVQARGIETYILNFANNQSAAAVAARENAASGQSMAALPDFVKAIALNNKRDESRDLATLVQRSMVDRLRGQNKTLRNLGVKQAPFVVLIGATMPSVLAEISFLTNAQDARLLKSGPYRQRIADALFDAVVKYQTSLNHVQTVAHQ